MLNFLVQSFTSPHLPKGVGDSGILVTRMCKVMFLSLKLMPFWIRNFVKSFKAEVFLVTSFLGVVS